MVEIHKKFTIYLIGGLLIFFMNLLFTTFSHNPNIARTSQIVSKHYKNIYIKNAFNALKSAKYFNPSLRVILFVDFKLDLIFQNLFTQNSIEVIYVPFNEFIFPVSFIWKLAYYKINCLSYITKHLDFDKALLIDNDVVVTGNLNSLFDELTDLNMFYLLDHTLNHPDRARIINLNKLLLNNDKPILHLGGEFIAGSKKSLAELLVKCNDVYSRIKEINFNIDPFNGDESLLSIAASMLNNKTYSAGYIYRYWTRRYYLTSTNYYYQNVPIWHVPQEKETGMLLIYKDLKKEKKINLKKWANYLGLPKLRRPISFNYFFSLLNKVINK
jgi:hypothetical protein